MNISEKLYNTIDNYKKLGIRLGGDVLYQKKMQEEGTIQKRDNCLQN